MVVCGDLISTEERGTTFYMRKTQLGFKYQFSLYHQFVDQSMRLTEVLTDNEGQSLPQGNRQTTHLEGGLQSTHNAEYNHRKDVVLGKAAPPSKANDNVEVRKDVDQNKEANQDPRKVYRTGQVGGNC